MSNEQAERMRHLIDRWSSPATAFSLKSGLDAALAAERRATVERIKKAYLASDVADGSESFNQGIDAASANLFAILDAEAE